MVSDYVPVKEVTTQYLLSSTHAMLDQDLGRDLCHLLHLDLVGPEGGREDRDPFGFRVEKGDGLVAG